jgi:hypothetical protein
MRKTFLAFLGALKSLRHPDGGRIKVRSASMLDATQRDRLFWPRPEKSRSAPWRTQNERPQAATARLPIRAIAYWHARPPRTAQKNTLVSCANSSHQGIMEEVESKNNAPFDDAKLGFLLRVPFFERSSNCRKFGLLGGKFGPPLPPQHRPASQIESLHSSTTLARCASR